MEKIKKIQEEREAEDEQKRIAAIKDSVVQKTIRLAKEQ